MQPQNVAEAYGQLVHTLQALYSPGESESIADLVIEELTGISPLRTGKFQNTVLNERQYVTFENITNELAKGVPVQYILGYAWFNGHKFMVNNSVLIPRQETEELVDLVLKNTKNNSSIIDLGTGSGCIAVSLAMSNKFHTVHAIDISEEALAVATKNAQAFSVDVRFQQINLLNETNFDRFPEVDYIVSNPPYISSAEKTAMHRNVLEHEPHLALFSEDDPLIFYKQIALLGNKNLHSGGKIFVEINEHFAKETAEIFATYKYKNIRILKDMQRKERMIRCDW